MKKVNAMDFPIAVNVCEQVLREIEKQPQWSMAHVIMNPLAESRLHEHKKMDEIYVITKGFGELGLGFPGAGSHYYQVTAGSVFKIDSNLPQILRNKSASHLEHLVFALPPFDPNDVHLIDGLRLDEKIIPLSLPGVEDCFDGAKIIPYEFLDLDMSIAFGWVINDPARRKTPHYHKKITEFTFVVDGKGYIEINGILEPIQPGDWIKIEPEERHAFVNESPEDMVVVCVCSPAFQMEDVHYFRR